MSALPDKGSLRQVGAPPVGQVLVQRGLLDQEQLEAALAEQKRTNQPIGQIIVDLGFVAPTIVAHALATQHGGLLQTEFGWATGFKSAPSAVTPAVPPAAPPLVEAQIDPEPPLRLSPPPAQDPAQPRTPEPVPLPPRVGPAVEVRSLEPELTAARDELAELRAKHEALEEESAARVAQLEQRAEALGIENEQLRADLAAAQPEPEPEPPVFDSHLAFAVSEGAYRLVACPGPPPETGAVVELPPETGVGGSHIVMRVGEAGLPGDRTPCAYLVPVG